MRKKKGKDTAGKGCLFLFALPFAVAGLFVLYSTVLQPFLKMQNAKSWPSIQGKIIECKLEVHSDSDGTSYSVEGRYSYEYLGKSYENDELTFGGMSTGGASKELFAKLERHRQEDLSIPVYVNPEYPQDAILDRKVAVTTLLMGFLFGAVFTGAGLGLIVFAFWPKKKPKLDERGEEVFAKEYQSSNKSSTIFIWVFALFWNGITWTVSLGFLTDSGNKPWFVFLFLGVFQLVGLGFLVAALYSLFKRMKYGKSRLMFNDVPVLVGSSFEAKILAPLNLYPENGVINIALQSIHRYTSGSGDSRSTHEDVLWQDKVEVPMEKMKQDMSHQEIPLNFTIPFSCQESSESPEHFWRIVGEAETAGIDWSEQFVFPVWRTEQSSEEISGETLLADKEEMNLRDLKTALRAEKTPFEERPGGGFLVKKPRCRSIVGALFSTVFFSAAFIGLGAAIWNKSFFFIIFAAIALLITGIIFISVVIQERQVLIDKRGLRLVENYLFFSHRSEILGSEVEDFETRNTMTSGNTRYWSLSAIDAQDKRHRVLSDIKDQELLKQVEILCRKLWSEE